MVEERIDFGIDEEKFFEKCVKNKNIPKNDALKQILLKKIINDFEEDKTYHESEVNKIIKKYFEDYALIRRELVNFSYMQRDPYKSEYRVVKRELMRSDFLKITLLKRAAIGLGIIEGG